MKQRNLTGVRGIVISIAMMGLSSLTINQAAQCTEGPPALKLHLSADNTEAGKFPPQFHVELTNRSDHEIVGGNLHLIITVDREHASQIWARSPTFSWGEFQLGPGERSVRVLLSETLVFTDEHAGHYDRNAVKGMLNMSRWSVWALAADETGHDPDEYPTKDVGSNVLTFSPAGKGPGKP